jgi:hypothetical protein
MLKVVETKIIGRSSRKNKTNKHKLLTFSQENINIFVGRLKEKDGKIATGIKKKRPQT